MARRISLDAVCGLIDALLHKGYPSVAEVARLLCVSPRTLQRQLNAEGVCYSDIVDRCRRIAARRLLESTRKPVRDIASELGYRDAGSFSRAFRRWSGCSPRVYRRNSLGWNHDDCVS